MTEPQAKALVAKLLAAYPHPRIEPLTAKVYIEAVQKLKSYEAMLEAVDRLIASERMLPRVADIYEMYHSLRDKYAPPALPMPDLTEEEIAENLKRVRELMERYAPVKAMPA